MIYLSSLDSIIESAYLEDSVSAKIGECNVFVNPDGIKYITSKIVILTYPGYEESKIETLFNNGCKVISRVYYDNPRVEIQPYILRLNYNIMWNGKILETYEGDRELVDSGSIEYSDGTLYFPQIRDKKIVATDSYGNLTSLGWALQQVGINIKKDTCFTNLDIIKTGKAVL